jgi:hypothetical protein
LGESGNGVIKTPGIEGGDDTASGPGGFPAGLVLFNQGDSHPCGMQLICREHADYATTYYQALCHEINL